MGVAVQETASMPDAFEQYLTPLIFERFAAMLADAIIRTRPSNVIEIGAGSGILTRALVPNLDFSTPYYAVDKNQFMLERAAFRQPKPNKVEWLNADAAQLPFDDQSVDIVCCHFGVMFFDNRIAVYREAKRVLRKGGRLIFNTWDHLKFNTFAKNIIEATSFLYPEDPPDFLVKSAHGYHDIGLIKREIAAAGFIRLRIRSTSDISTAPTAMHPAIAYCQGTSLRNEIELREPGGLHRVTEIVAKSIEKEFGPGPVSAKTKGHLVTATV